MAQLPRELVALLDGSGLEQKVGTTLLVVATGDDGWPRVATVSVGELLALSPEELLVSLYASSRTTAALVESGRALLLATNKGSIVRTRIEPVPLDDPAAEAAGRRSFRCAVVEVEIDAVPYARVTHGIEFELLDRGDTLVRWSRQLAELEQLAERLGARP